MDEDEEDLKLVLVPDGLDVDAPDCRGGTDIAVGGSTIGVYLEYRQYDIDERV